MNKSLTLSWFLALALLWPGSILAKRVSPAEALERASSETSASLMKKRPVKGKTLLAHTFTSEKGEPMLYAFNKGEGYMLLPADDSFPAIIGFGDNGTFDIEKAPASMKWFIDECTREMETALQAGTEATRYATADYGWEPVAPLLKSKWDQGDPYNLMSPPLELADGSQTIPTVTGCVATSLAQVMYYHKWPDIGVGSNSYDWKPYSDVVGKKLTCDFSKTRFDWDNMLDTYAYDAEGNPAWTDAQGKAVAELMYACGISVNMTYNMEAAGGSGAVSRQQSVALVENFKYSRSIRYKYRDWCSSREFEEIIYNNLKEGLPVLYNGRSSAGGHSFVCDGYAGNHYFHFNWGWSGVSDGYFYLARLNPESLGIGGAAGGFNSSQGISYNIRPVKDGNDTGVAEDPYFCCVGNFDFDSRKEEKASNNQTLMFTRFKVTDPKSGYNAGFWNLSSVPFTGYLGVIVENKNGKEDESKFIIGLSADKLAANSGTQTIPAYLEEFTEGVYTIRPAYYNTVTGNGEYLPVANGYRDYVTMTVDAEGNRTFKNADLTDDIGSAPEMAVTCFNYNGELYGNVAHEFLMTVANHADKDYYGDMTMILKNSKGKVLATFPLGKYDVPAGMTIPYTFNLTLDLLKNNYTVAFQDSYGRELPGEYPLIISKKGSAITSQLRVTSYTPVDILPLSVVPVVTFQVGNYGTTAVTAPEFFLLFNKLGDNQQKGWRFSYPQLTIESNRAYNLRFTNVNFNLEEGDYEVRMYWNKPSETEGGEPVRTLISNPIALRVGNPVTSVTLPAEGVEMKPGETRKLSAALEPENATFRILSWISSNPAVATVDNDGNVTAVSPGHAHISATAHNGSTDSVMVTVSETSAVAEITAAGAKVIAVFTPGGTKVLDNPETTQLRNLPKGIYIIKTDKGAFKLTR